MSVLFIALPLALVLGAIAVFAFVAAVRTGQFDDLDTPPVRVIFDDADAAPRRPPTEQLDGSLEKRSNTGS
jgi:cbb3-type cytochrome oxidase maturation protein